MGELVIEVLGLLLLFILNGVFAMSELAIVSARKTKLQERANEGHKGARAALELANDPGAFLATVQIGITLVGILAGAFAGTTVARVLADWLGAFEPLHPYRAELAFAVTVTAITYLSLVIGELVPKRLSLRNPELVASLVARPMRLLALAAGPAVRFLDQSTRALLWLLRVKPDSAAAAPVTEKELRILVGQATSAGEIHEAAHAVVDNVLDFGNRRAASLMVQRADIVCLDIKEPLHVTWRRIRGSGQARFPLCRGGLDDIIGMVSVESLVGQTDIATPDDLQRYAQAPVYIPESAPAFQVLETFKQTHQHVSLVIDEFGVVAGLLTLTDLMESLVGEVPVLAEAGESPMLRRADGSWLLDGLVPVERFKARFDVRELRHEARGGYGTLGGFVMMFFGRVPRTGDRFEWAGYRFEVVDMDGNRVDKILLTPLPGTIVPPAHTPKPHGA
jgi:putative hemolysin